MHREDDSVQSSNTPVGFSYKEEAKDYSIYRCLIISVMYIDDAKNITKGSEVPEVLYDVQIIGGYKEGHIIPNVRVMQSAGGNNNYSERIFKASTKSQTQAGLSKQDGDIVYVGFVAGDMGAPIILGGANHVLDKDRTGSTKATGPRLRSQYNGIFTEIDKDGNYMLKRLGGSYDENTGEFIPNYDGLAVIIQYEDNKIVRSVKDETIKEEVLGDDEKLVRTYKTGLKVVEDGKNDIVTITTSGGAKAVIDGANQNVTIESGTAKIIIDNAGKITVSGDFVDLGKSASDFVTKFMELATAFNSHSHLVPVTSGSSGGVYPSNPPIAPLLNSVGSLTVKVQD